MALKILATGDWQVRLGNLDRCQVMRKQFMDLIQEHRPDLILHLGDVKDAFNPIDQRVTNFIIETTQMIVDKCPMVVIRGNHDHISTAEDSEDGFPVLGAAGATAITSPSLVQTADSKVFIHAVPFFRDNAKLLHALKNKLKMPEGAVCVLAFHADLAEGMMSVITKGNGISVKDIPTQQYALCLGGHYHYQQKVGNNVWYVGSPFPHDWGEANQTKGFLLAEIANGKARVTQIPSALPGWYDPLLPGFPKAGGTYWEATHVRIRVPIQTTNAAKEMEKVKNSSEKLYPGAVLHMVPEFNNVLEAPATVKVHGTDEEIITAYLKDAVKGTTISHEEAAAYIVTKVRAGSGVGVTGVTFESVEAKNVLCFDTVKLALNEPGITLVTGRNLDWGGKSNGAGKSSLLSLPFVALLGTTPKGQTHDAWRRRDSTGVSEAKLTMRLSDGRQCIIRRQRPLGLSFMIDGKEHALGDPKATQRLIEATTNLTWDVLANSLYISQKDIGTALTGTPKEQKELFTRFLGLDRFLKAQQSIGEDLTAANNVIREVQGWVAEAEARVEECRTSLNNLVEIPDVPKIELAAALKNLKVEERALRNVEDVRKVAQDRVLTIHMKLAKATFTAENKRNERDRIEGIMLKLQKPQAKVCPTCGQKLQQKDVTDLVEEAAQAYRTAYTEWREAAEQVKVFRNRQDVAQAELEAINITDLMEKKTKAENDLRALERQARDAAKARDARKTLEDRIAAIEATVAIHQNYLEYLREYSSFVSFCRAAVGRDGLPAFLCATAAPQLNYAAHRYGTLLTEGELQVSFALKNGDIEIGVENLHGGKTIEDQSMGESRLVGLITAFAFREVLMPHNILILDEPGEGLDAISAQSFAEGLNRVAETFGTVFLTTHNPHILAALEPATHIEVVKSNRVSNVHKWKGVQ